MLLELTLFEFGYIDKFEEQQEKHSTHSGISDARHCWIELHDSLYKGCRWQAGLYSIFRGASGYAHTRKGS